ncbi:MAG TPA: cell division protein FtsZ [Verrucomicrobiae bacterium]
MAHDQSLAPRNELRVRLVGIGGAGCNVVDHISRTDLGRLPLSLVHTHARVLQQHSIEHRILIGTNRTHGLGSGGDSDLARVMAEEAGTDLREVVADTDLLFLLCGLGGGTGTGATPVLARAGKQAGALVIVIAITPFDFEGGRRSKQAQAALQTLRTIADAVICLPNEKARTLLQADATVLQTFARTNDMLAQGLQGLWQMLTRPGVINVDFGYLHSVLRGRHNESILVAEAAEGENRVSQVIGHLLANPLLNKGTALAEADQVLVSVCSSSGLTVAEISQLTDGLRRHIETEDFILGTALDESLGDKLSITLIVSKGGKGLSAEVLEGNVSIIRETSPVVDQSYFNDNTTPRPAPRYVAPPPATTPEKTRELLDKQPAGRMLKVASKWKQELLALEIVSRGRFEKSEPTIHRGADLDVPTYVRRGVPLN